MKFRLFYIILFFILASIQSYADISYSSVGNSKALGLDISFSYPDDWQKLKINAPNVAEYIQKTEEDNVLGITIGISAIPEDEFDKNEVIKMFFADDYPEYYAELYSAELLSFKRYRKDGLNYLRLFLRRKDASGMEVYQITTVCFLGRHCIEIACVAMSFNREISSLNLYKKNEALLLKISDSININKDIISANKAIDFYDKDRYSSDYEEFKNNDVSTFNSRDFAEYKYPNFTFKYPRSWILNELKGSNRLGSLSSNRNSSNSRKVFSVECIIFTPRNIDEILPIFNSLREANSILKKKYKNLRNIEYVYIDGIKSISFLTTDKVNDLNIIAKEIIIPLDSCAIRLSVGYLSTKPTEKFKDELNADKKLFEEIFNTVKFENKELLKYKNEISKTYLERKEYAINEEKTSSLKAGEGLVFSIPETCSFQIPHTMEVLGGYYKELTKGLFELSEIKDEYEITFQQKGLNAFKDEAFREYCRIFVRIEKSEDASISINDPIPLKYSDLEELYIDIKKEHEKSKDLKIQDKTMKTLSIKKPRIKRINNIDCLYLELERQLGDNPVMLRCSYTFFNYDREISFITNYRIRDKDKWEEQMEDFLYSIKFHDRKENSNNIPKDAMHISGEKIDGHLYIPVKISGNIGTLETLLMFDSGATISMLPESVFRTVSTFASKSSAEFETFTGVSKINTSMLTLETGNVKKKIEFAVSPKASAGVIGLNFFEGYKYIVNMENSKIYFWK